MIQRLRRKKLHPTPSPHPQTGSGGMQEQLLNVSGLYLLPLLLHPGLVWKGQTIGLNSRARGIQSPAVGSTGMWSKVGFFLFICVSNLL